ncbi:hypothetical protein AB0N81_22685 [Streptomyces sp. NPDC093510]|uniref:hypothetical protein n=1 Tax=Streptomyces sp. NPDC093510 TaxID=3155199 RepID=UPI0034191B6C
MQEYLLADVPLGPFEGTRITLYSARGKNARLHVARACGQLRTSDVKTAQVALDAEVMGRLCSRCTEWGSWARPTTALGMFLRALGGVGLLHQLQSYTEPDEDECWTQEEVEAAAEVLRSDAEATDDDGEDAREDAERLQGLVFSYWHRAAESLHRAQSILASFLWLEDWAQRALETKAEFLETLRSQAALFVEPAGLLVAAAAATMERPRLSGEDPAFAVLGSSDKISTALNALWRRWQGAAESSWVGSPARSYMSHYLVQGIRSNRKGHDDALAGAARLIDSWEAQARALAASAEGKPTQRVTARLPEATEETARGVRGGLLEGLDSWTQGVVATWVVGADWGRRTLTLDVPALIAERLHAPSSDVACEPPREEADAIEASRTPAGRPSSIRPGVFDDTPVFDRQPVTAEHIRALRTFTRSPDQLYIVISVSGGVEVLPHDVVERRLAQGWSGVLVAGASDLPESLIGTWAQTAGSELEAGGSHWTGGCRDAHDLHFGEEFGGIDGARQTVRHTYFDADRARNLRLLALTRGVHDLRTLDAGRERMLPLAVWEGTLASDRLDLAPFMQPSADRWHRGSGLPLGPLAVAQIYTTNADPQIEGKGHSPLCRHARERGVATNDDLLTVTDLLARDDFDWCGKCGGYAVRRLTDTQVSLYRAAHRLHAITAQLDRGRCHDDADTVLSQLEELADWQPIDEEGWYTSDSWRWHEAIRNLKRKVERARRDEIS